MGNIKFKMIYFLTDDRKEMLIESENHLYKSSDFGQTWTKFKKVKAINEEKLNKTK